METSHAPATEQEQQGARQDEKIPACQSCQRRKAKCSREQPCSQCVRFQAECIYDDRRFKPGLKAGAMQQLQKRVDTLEKMFLGQGMLWQQVWAALHPNSEPTVSPGDCTDSLDNRVDILDWQNRLKRSFINRANDGNNNNEYPVQSLPTHASTDEPSPAKRQRVEIEMVPLPKQESQDDIFLTILESDLLISLVEFYFANIHHWIPMLHLRRFREQIQTREGRQKAIHILHAITAVCVRYLSDPRLGNDEDKAKLAENSRQKVILSMTDAFSVESLQASVIIAFDTLSVEEDDLFPQIRPGEMLIRRMEFLKPSQSWMEAEQRRRLFWTIFLVDRFCNVSTGWNVSLTGADVKRRLPCEGSRWAREIEVQAPYFGISDIKGCSSHPSQPENSKHARDSADTVLSGQREAIGGFAYCIEATESLSLVTNFFLHHALDLQSAEKTQMWLMRFKELDFRMVQWKLFLPAKWRDALVMDTDGVMDPNLTLAHMIHSTAVILLHQGIAYPPQHWQLCSVRLPSRSSAETCVEAASEISTIGQKFLSSSTILTNPQFCFCLFIAGRLLLAHSKYNNAPIPDTLETVIASLFEISHLWLGPRHMNGPRGENLASVFARRLVYARDSSSVAPATGSLDIRQTAYFEAGEERGSTSNPADRANNTLPEPRDFSVLLTDIDAELYDGFGMPAGGGGGTGIGGDLFGQHLSLAFPPLPLSFQNAYGPVQDVPESPAKTALGAAAAAAVQQSPFSHPLSAPPRDVASSYGTSEGGTV